MILDGTANGRRIALTLTIVWLWVPVTLLTAFGADIRSQIREFSWAWNQWLGIPQPYIGFFTFVPMDIYPTAHYMWPANPTYLTDQHNIVLTVFYGSVAAVSRYLTGSNDAGLVALSLLQWAFAIFCCAATANRFLNLPWLTARRMSETRGEGVATDHTLAATARAAGNAAAMAPGSAAPIKPAGALARMLMLLFLMFCPLAVFSTISLTKSPLFAFAFVWWFGIGYELHATRSTWQHTGVRRPLRRSSLIALALATSVMLISAKYAFYILVVQLVLLAIGDPRRWKTYAVALLLPIVFIHGGINLLVARGMIIGGDPIESRGIQVQQIARVAKLKPRGIPDDARMAIARVFNLDQMADAYSPVDADPAKSSGIQSKKVSYRWRTVSQQDMRDFDRAWMQIVRANPTISADAFFAKCYGYFDVADLPYVTMSYYVSNGYVQDNTVWISSWMPEWRKTIAGFSDEWSDIPVIGWVTHGNFYVVLTMLIGAAEVVLRRWRTLIWHVPLLLLMGVMITAPANNFERHMLPLAFVFGYVALTFWRESRGSRLKS